MVYVVCRPKWCYIGAGLLLFALALVTINLSYDSMSAFLFVRDLHVRLLMLTSCDSYAFLLSVLLSPAFV